MTTISIVLADDHPVTREGLRSVLSAELDFSIAGEAWDGLAAVELVKQFRPDILVLDMNMPSLDGFGVMQQIKQYSPQTRVMVFSMSDEEGYVWLTFQRGAAGYVLKNAPADEVVKGIREVVAGRRYLSSPLSDLAVKAFLRQDETPPQVADTPLSQREHEVLQLLNETKKWLWF